MSKDTDLAEASKPAGENLTQLLVTALRAVLKYVRTSGEGEVKIQVPDDATLAKKHRIIADALDDKDWAVQHARELLAKIDQQAKQ